MTTKSNPAWQIYCSDVGVTLFSSVRPGRSTGELSKSSRAKDTKSGEIRMTHVPTGISVMGYVPAGNYSKKFWKQEQRKVEDKLFVLLEAKIAKQLRIPGYLPKSVE